MRRAPAHSSGPARRALALLLLCAACPAQRTAPAVEHLISAAERALARAALEAEARRARGAEAAPVGGSGLDLTPLLAERGLVAQHRRLLAESSPAALVARLPGLTSERSLYLLCALLDHPSPEVRLAALTSLRALRDPRSAAVLIAVAKNNVHPPGAGARAEAALRFRRLLAAALEEITGVAPAMVEDAGDDAPAAPGVVFDFGQLERWLELRVIEAERWPG